MNGAGRQVPDAPGSLGGAYREDRVRHDIKGELYHGPSAHGEPHVSVTEVTRCGKCAGE